MPRRCPWQSPCNSRKRRASPAARPPDDRQTRRESPLAVARVQARRARTIERDVCGIRKRLVDMVPPERRPRVCAPPQFFLAAITINWQTYWLGFASSRRLVATTANRTGIGIVFARARKERLASMRVVGILGDERRADNVVLDLQARRDRDIRRSHILTSWVVRRVGKHSSE